MVAIHEDPRTSSVFGKTNAVGSYIEDSVNAPQQNVANEPNIYKPVTISRRKNLESKHAVPPMGIPVIEATQSVSLPFTFAALNFSGGISQDLPENDRLKVGTLSHGTIATINNTGSYMEESGTHQTRNRER